MFTCCSPVQQQIFWLQISVDNAQAMKIIQSTYNLSRVEECCCVVESSSASKVTEQFSPTHVWEQHVEKALILGTPT